MRRIKHWIKLYFQSLVYRQKRSDKRRIAMESFLDNNMFAAKTRLDRASFDIFTYHGEDGIIGYLLRNLGNVNKKFIDIGAGDCITGNCACLAVHYNWSGVFIDANKNQLSIGKRFYKSNGKVKFVETLVAPDTIDELLSTLCNGEEVGLLSIDIDGNDYWIWKAIETIKPAIVVIEAKIEYGIQEVIVPYSIENNRNNNEMYNGASVKAFEKLGKRKGYKLVGANKQGYNLFFVRADATYNASPAEALLANINIQQCFYPNSFFNQYEFVTE
ncbi:MAG: hypothetical protein V9F02_05460 [Chitinophagaceae bacterium]